MSRHLVRFVAAAVLAVLLAFNAVPAWAEGPVQEAPSLVQQVWAWLASLWGAGSGSAACAANPQGPGCTDGGAATLQGDHGCTIDPNGVCKP